MIMKIVVENRIPYIQGVLEPVVKWVFAAIGQWMHECDISDARGLTLGVIGVGHVGSIVARWGEQLGFKVLLNDPPLGIGCTFNHLLEQSDIIAIHTPLTRDGQRPSHPARHHTQLRPHAPDLPTEI